MRNNHNLWYFTQHHIITLWYWPLASGQSSYYAVSSCACERHDLKIFDHTGYNQSSHIVPCHVKERVALVVSYRKPSHTVEPHNACTHMYCKNVVETHIVPCQRKGGTDGQCHLSRAFTRIGTTCQQGHWKWMPVSLGGTRFFLDQDEFKLYSSTHVHWKWMPVSLLGTRLGPLFSWPILNWTIQ